MRNLDDLNRVLLDFPQYIKITGIFYSSKSMFYTLELSTIKVVSCCQGFPINKKKKIHGASINILSINCNKVYILGKIPFYILFFKSTKIRNTRQKEVEV